MNVQIRRIVADLCRMYDNSGVVGADNPNYYLKLQIFIFSIKLSLPYL